MSVLPFDVGYIYCDVIKMHGKALPSPTPPNYGGKLNSLTEISEYLQLSLGAKNHGTAKDLILYILSFLPDKLSDFIEFQEG